MGFGLIRCKECKTINGRFARECKNCGREFYPENDTKQTKQSKPEDYGLFKVLALFFALLMMGLFFVSAISWWFS